MYHWPTSSNFWVMWFKLYFFVNSSFHWSQVTLSQSQSGSNEAISNLIGSKWYCHFYWKWDTYVELGQSISLSFLNWNGWNLVSRHIFSRCLDIQNFSSLSLVLPPGKNDRPFSDNFVIWDPMNLVGGSNWSLGSSRFDEISTVALGQCFIMRCWFVDKNPGWKWWQVGKDVVVHVAI